MNLLVLKGFNNYFNRIIKRYNTLDDYISRSESHYDFANINFNPNDGVTTTQILGSENQKDAGGPELVPLAWEKDGNPDYIIAYETEQVGIATVQVIRSRWFIVESVRTRNGQYSLKLKRDSIADHLETLLSAPAFIKKGTVSDDNPLIVNSEGITVNQIKSGETLLKDKTGSAWIVGYMAKNAPSANITEQILDDTQFFFETIENIASELGIESSDLDAILTQNTNNQSFFINDNIEVVGWVNMADASPLEWRLIAGSQNFLSSFSYNKFDAASHSNTSDCFAKEKNADYFSRLQFTGMGTYWQNAVAPYVNTIKQNWKNYTKHPFFTKEVFDYLTNLATNGTFIYKQGRYYKVKSGTIEGPKNTGDLYFSSAVVAPFSNICVNFVNAWNEDHPETPTRKSLLEMLDGGKIFINYNEIIANFYLEEVSNTADVPGITVTMSSTRNAIQNQPYDMFAIPFSNITASDGVDDYDIYGDYAQKIAMALIKGLTNANVYDIQLLPYCPIPQIANNNSIDVSGLTSGKDYDWINYTGDYLDYKTLTQSNNSWLPSATNEYSITFNAQSDLPPASIDSWGYEYITSRSIIDETKSQSAAGSGTNFTVQLKTLSMSVVPLESVQMTIWWKEKKNGTVHRQIIIYPNNNSFSVALDYNLTLKESMKIDSQTDLYRLVSPNYQGSFDFNVAKNGGAVNGFIADCTYKPYTPYIKVSPNFSWLYGSNYGDCRGLICGGDFSIGFLQDAWENYQLNNKNYQNIFNREIQNLDVNQGIQRTQQYISGGLNIARDTIAGGVGGGLATGSPYGAIAGAVVGGIGSGIGYAADMNLMERGLQEQRQFSIDKFRMQLGNIQALPYTLTKVGAFNINSKVWPFLEYYTCSEQEKEALKMKIQYEGMTVGVVDILGNYMTGGYVQADLIRNKDVIDDSHLLDDIYIELTKGVYM